VCGSSSSFPSWSVYCICPDHELYFRWFLNVNRCFGLGFLWRGHGCSPVGYSTSTSSSSARTATNKVVNTPESRVPCKCPCPASRQDYSRVPVSRQSWGACVHLFWSVRSASRNGTFTHALDDGRTLASGFWLRLELALKRRSGPWSKCSSTPFGDQRRLPEGLTIIGAEALLSRNEKGE
jgi:hypothetical protein